MQSKENKESEYQRERDCENDPLCENDDGLTHSVHCGDGYLVGGQQVATGSSVMRERIVGCKKSG